jgi:hypothetical protein
VTKQQQYLLLGALVIVLGGTVAYQLSGDDTAGSASQPSNRSRRATDAANRGATGGTAASGLSGVDDVGLDRLTAARDALQPAERNPFRFRPKPPPPPPPMPRQVVRPVQPTGPPVPAGPAPPPRIELRYIGYATPRRAPGETGPALLLGVFSDGKGTVVNAKEGDILEGRYRVLRVGTDSAELVYLDGRGRQVIPLRGQ